jgi:hypothetical protein
VGKLARVVPFAAQVLPTYPLALPWFVLPELEVVGELLPPEPQGQLQEALGGRGPPGVLTRLLPV